MIFTEILKRFSNVAKNGKGFKALCPAHADQNPSLKITEGKDGKTLFYCHAGCTPADVAAAVGLDLTDLFPVSKTFTKQPAAKPTKKAARRSDADIEAVYNYRDEQGNLLFQSVRYANPKEFRQRQPNGNGWRWTLDGVPLVLYRLPELLAANPNIEVFICEGEKDCERLIAEGLIATTNPMGAGKWNAKYSQVWLEDRHVVILPDNDQPGREHAEAVAQSLQGFAKSIKVLELPGLPAKGDVSDWLDTTGDAETLCKLVDGCDEWNPALGAKTSSVTAGNQTSQNTVTDDENDLPLRVVRMADVAPETVTWMWKPYIAFGKLTLIEGDPGVGKSWLTCGLATAIAAGKGLPGMLATTPRNVLMLSAEDGLGDTIRPRLDSMKADVSRIFAVDEPVSFDAAGLLRIETAIQHFKPALVIVDPLVAFLGAAVDMHRANETRAVMTRLAEVATRCQCAIVIVRHLSKGAGGKAIYRGQGSIDFTAAVRSSLLIGCDPDEPAKRAIVQIKNNLEAFGKPLGYEIRDGQFWWTGESTLTADKILSISSREDTSTESSNARIDAEEFLMTVLADGQMLASDVQEEARKAGLSVITLRRAKDQLGVKARKRGFGKETKWYWVLPDLETSLTEPKMITKMIIYDEVDHLKVNTTVQDSYDYGVI